MIRAVAVRGVVPLVLWVGMSTSLLAQGTSTEQNPTATFSTYGPHQVTLTACNMWGCTSITKTVTVLDPRPAVTSAAALLTAVEAGQAVPLSGAATGQPPLAYTWRVYQGASLLKELSGASAFWPTGGMAPGLYTFVLSAANGSGVAESLPQAALVTGAAPPLDFYTVEPCRVLDTRFGSPLGAGAAKLVSLVDVCGIPPGARAVAANVTVPGPAISGSVSLYPGNYPPMATNTISFSAGRTVANNATLPLSTDGAGTVAAFAGIAGGATVNLVIDVAGYYLPEAP
jgi:PKD repeat protein